MKDKYCNAKKRKNAEYEDNYINCLLEDKHINCTDEELLETLHNYHVK